MMRSRGLKMANNQQTAIWTFTDTAVTDGDEVTVPIATSPSTRLKPASVYRVLAYGNYTIDAPSGGCEAQITLGQDGTVWSRVSIATDSNITEPYHWRIMAWVRTGAGSVHLRPEITARLTGSSSGEALLTIGGGDVPGRIVATREARAGDIAGVDALVVDL